MEMQLIVLMISGCLLTMGLIEFIVVPAYMKKRKAKKRITKKRVSRNYPS